MLFRDEPGPDAAVAIRGARRRVYWLDQPDRPAARDSVIGVDAADLLVVGGGFTGLWAALLAKQAEPGRDVLLVDGGRIADGATGRNGGFVSASLTHGFANGMQRWPEDMPHLLQLGRDNLDAIEKTVHDFGIECDWLRSGELDVAVQPYQCERLQAMTSAVTALGQQVVYLDAEQTRGRVDSPTYLGALWDPDVAMIDPARLAWGLRRACLEVGVRIAERTPVTGLSRSGSTVVARTRQGLVRAERVLLATNAYPSLLRRVASYVVPVYDYVLMTEPLSDRQLSAVGWSGREGVSDTGNQFHYYRMTQDGRILWGGYDAIYHGTVSPRHDHHDGSYLRLAANFLQTFPQLADVRFSHAWGGPIDTCSRFSAFWGTAFGGRVAYVAGFTGLGVGASRFGAATMLDLVDGRSTERTELSMVQTKPLPFPPEPVRGLGIRLTTSALRRADANEGRRGPWLRTLDRLGMGFDS